MDLLGTEFPVGGGVSPLGQWISCAPKKCHPTQQLPYNIPTTVIFFTCHFTQVLAFFDRMLPSKELMRCLA